MSHSTSNGARQLLSNRRSNRHIVPLYGKSDRLFTGVFRFEEHCPPFEVPWKTAKCDALPRRSGGARSGCCARRDPRRRVIHNVTIIIQHVSRNGMCCKQVNYCKYTRVSICGR